MDVKHAIRARRAYRSLEPVEMTDEILEALTESARLTPSCFNNQPWQFVFVHEKDMLERMHGTLSRGNVWARDASMIIAVYSEKDHDCVIGDRSYYLFDTGMATAFIILRATELGLVAHPIAGYDHDRTREILGIPDDTIVIALVIVGKHADTISPALSEKQVESERNRPERLPPDGIVHMNRVPDDA